LNPKSYKEYLQSTADQLNVSKSAVEDSIDFFYSRVRKSLIDMKHKNVHVHNFGTFKAKKSELDRLYKKYKNHLSILENPETFSQMKIKKDVEEKFQKVMGLYKIINEESKRKTQIKRSKYEFKTNDNLEEPERDPGGN
jgi:nucleoid DNA-binding protein